MSRSEVDRVADAILYEGYLLYPYRPSSIKNRQRWTFGGVYPRAYSLAHAGAEPWAVQTEVLVRDRPETALRVRLRFLHLLERWMEEGPTGSRWQEATEREVEIEVGLAEVLKKESGDESPHSKKFSFAASRALTPVADKGGVVVRQHQAVAGAVELTAHRVGEDLVRLTVRIHNLTPMEQPQDRSRDEALLCAFVSTHTILHVRDGAFVSLLDPPEDCRELAGQCQNVGAWPVLIGADGATDTMLSAPIILYDYPRVAPESPGDLFDATEIDEVLTLRILTLTEDEKREMCAGDERAAALLERTEALARDQLLGLHGAVRGLRPVRKEGPT